MLLFALGSNAPSEGMTAPATVLAAFEQLQKVFGMGVLSRLYRTPAFPAGNGPDFANAAARFDVRHDPEAVLEEAHKIEAAFARVRQARWAARSLDIDLIAAGDAVLPDATTLQAWRDLPLDAQMEHTPNSLILPHPRLWERAFVLVPLADVAPDWTDPLTGQTVAEGLKALPQGQIDEVVPWDKGDQVLSSAR